MNETLVRSLSGAVYVSVLLFATLFSKESFLILFILFLLQTVIEFSKLIKLNSIFALTVSVVLFIVFALFLDSNEYNNDIIILAFSLSTSLRLIFWLFETKNDVNTSILTKWFLLIGYIIFSFVLLKKLVVVSHISRDPYLPSIESTYNPQILIAIFILIWTNDSFAYLVGKSIGKNKLFERISPKKTIEGFLGGMLFSMIASVLISLFYATQFPIWQWLVIAVIVSVFGTLGDLIESKFKRNAGVKDSGKIMPGHGGIYDRLDSVIFVIPFIFLFFKILEYVS